MKKNFLVLSLGLALFAASCKEKKEDPQPIITSNGDDIVATASRQAKDDIVSWTQSEGADVVTSLSNILAVNDEPISANRISSAQDRINVGRIYKNKAKAFRSIFIPTQSGSFRKTAESDKFDFASNTGTYDFVKADSSWAYSASPSDKIILNFPSDTTSSVNDARLTIFDYSEVRHINEPGTYWADTNYLPTKIDAELNIGATKYVDVLYTGAYNAEGNPTSVNYTLFLKPFTETLTYSDGGSSVTITSSLSKEGESTSVLSTTESVTFHDNTKDSVTAISGFVQYRRLKLSGNLNIAAIDAEEAASGSSSITTLNSNVNIDVIDNSNSQKIGKIEFFDNAGKTDIRIRFTSDNSTKLASEYFDPILTELEAFVKEAE